ncbi:MAG: hypothetical protein JOY51_03575 [Nevskia sp.]|nr:hypothetical protein [Nevskia sp.]
MLLTNLAQYLRRKGADGRLHVVSSPPGEDDMPMLQPETEPHVARAELVEGEALQAIPLGSLAGVSSGFTCFLDGIQRGQVVYYQDLVPVVYGYAAAVIRARRERRMTTRWLAASEKLYLPYDWLDPGELQAAGIETADSSPEQELVRDDLHPLMLQRWADAAIAETRSRLEVELAQRWIDRGEGWLYLDGSTTLARDIAAHPRVVGVIKSHQTQYFPLDEQRKILALRAGERSSIFRPTTREFTPVYSWYVRLRPYAGQDLYFGLVRVEAPAAPATRELADTISRWLLGETQPLALPDGRWDRMIYPIRDCEEYLRSRAPTRVALEGLLGALKG